MLRLLGLCVCLWTAGESVCTAQILPPFQQKPPIVPPGPQLIDPPQLLTVPQLLAIQREVISRWYIRFLRRRPDAQGVQAYIDHLNRVNPQDALSVMLGSDEYFLLAKKRQSDFIALVFQDLLGRQPSVFEMRQWLIRLQRHGNRHQLVNEIQAEYRIPLPQ